MPVDLPSGLIQAFIQLAEEGAKYASPCKVVSLRRPITFMFLSIAACVGRLCHFHCKPKANIKRKIENALKSLPEPKPVYNPGGCVTPMFISCTQLF